jgi:hypothetical protein
VLRELATVKAVRPDGAVELEDGRVLDASDREGCETKIFPTETKLALFAGMCLVF